MTALSVTVTVNAIVTALLVMPVAYPILKKKISDRRKRARAENGGVKKKSREEKRAQAEWENFLSYSGDRQAEIETV